MAQRTEMMAIYHQQRRHIHAWIMDEKRPTLVKKVAERVVHVQTWRVRIIIPIVLIVLLFDFNAWMRRASFQQSNDEKFSATIRSKLPVRLSPIVDIISVGSLLKQSYQSAQQRTFANVTWSKSSPGIREFYRITEANDTDTICFTSLTSDQFNDIVKFCQHVSTHTSNDVTKVLIQDLFQPKKHAGYMCAQKRLIDGLYKVLQLQKQKDTKTAFFTDFQRQKSNLPDYLFILEDDTYVNMDLVLPHLPAYFPSHIPYAITGSQCTVPIPNRQNMWFTNLQIGYGTILTKAAIQRLLQPIFYTDSQHNHFAKLVQYQLLQNQMGEMHYFTEGMSIIDLMYGVASYNFYTNVDGWQENSINYDKKKDLYTKNMNTGYCFTSDTALAYFIHYYFITVPDDQLEQLSSMLTTTLSAVDQEKFDTARLQTASFVQIDAKNETSSNECSQHHIKQSDGKCTIHDRTCHKVSPEQMDRLHHQYYRGESINP